MNTAPTGCDRLVAGWNLPAMAPAGTWRSGCVLWWLFRQYRGQVLATQILFNAENLLRLAQPLVLGRAISDLMAHHAQGLFTLMTLQLLLLGTGFLRRRYDTRVFAAMHARLSEDITLSQRAGIDHSTIAARTALSREFVTFFERDFQFAATSAYSLAGSLSLLAAYDVWLSVACLAALVPCCLVNCRLARSACAFHRKIHDAQEREVGIIQARQRHLVRDHFQRLARLRIGLSDCEATSCALLEVPLILLLIGVLHRSCALLHLSVGDISAVVRYLTLFMSGLDAVPLLVQQAGRLRDISRRLEAQSPGEGRR